MSKDSMILYFEWSEICEDLTDEEFGQMMRAAMKYAEKGDNPTFSDRTMKACWKSIQKAIDRTSAAYEAQVERNRENGKKGGRPKKAEAEKNPETQVDIVGFSEKPTKTQENPHITHKNPPEREREPDRDPERERGRERDPKAAPPRTSLTTTTSEEIVTSWNDQKCTRDISSVLFPDQRRDRTEMAVAIAGGYEAFLDMISGLSEKAYFRDREVDFDWFVDPKYFQNIREGKYDEPRKKKKEGWE